MQVVIRIVGGIVVLLVVIFGLNYYGYMTNVFFMPRQEALRRETMIQSRAYNEATIRDLNRLRLQYTQAKSEDEKGALVALIRSDTQAGDIANLPDDLQTFLRTIGIGS
jgi:hypothetical protein